MRRRVGSFCLRSYGFPSLPRTTPLGNFFGGSVEVLAAAPSATGALLGCGSVLSPAIWVRRERQNIKSQLEIRAIRVMIATAENIHCMGDAAKPRRGAQLPAGNSRDAWKSDWQSDETGIRAVIDKLSHFGGVPRFQARPNGSSVLAPPVDCSLFLLPV